MQSLIRLFSSTALRKMPLPGLISVKVDLRACRTPNSHPDNQEKDSQSLLFRIKFQLYSICLASPRPWTWSLNTNRTGQRSIYVSVFCSTLGSQQPHHCSPLFHNSVRSRLKEEEVKKKKSCSHLEKKMNPRCHHRVSIPVV